MDQYNNQALNNQQGYYQQPEQDDVVSVKEWIGTLLLLCIPIAGIILVFVWAFGGDAKKSKSNYFKAALILYGIGIVLYILVIIFIVGAFGSLGALNY